MKSKFGQYGPTDDEYVLALRESSDMPNLQVWRGMAQSKGKIDYSKDFYYIDTGYFNDLNTSKIPYLGKKLKSHKSRIIFYKKKPIWVFLKNKLLSISSSEIRKTKTCT